VPEREPVRGQQLVGARAGHAGLERRGPGDIIDRASASSRRRSSAMTAAHPPRSGATPPTTLVPPERHDRDAVLGARAQDRADLVVRPGTTTASGARGGAAVRRTRSK